MKRNIKNLSLDLIRMDGGTQSRVAIDTSVVDDYVHAMEEGDELPEPVVFFDGVDHWLGDGFHRVHANRKLGARAMDVDVRDGTLADAIFYAAGANKSHGLRRSNADKRKAVQMLMESPSHGQLTNREIARQCGVSHTFVAQIREALSGNVASKTGGNVATAPATEEGLTTSQTPGTGAAAAGNVATPTTVATAPDTSAQQPGPAAVTRPAPSSKAGQAEDVAAAVDELGDALSDFDPIKELEAVQLELEGMRRDLTAATADDKAAEIVKWRRIAEQAQRRQNELMDQVNQREQELTWMTRALRQIGKAVGEADPKKVLKAVENLAAQLQP